MHLIANDPRAFVRPSPTRGALGGISKNTFQSVQLCEFFGCDVVLVESVGLGQSEIEIAQVCDHVLLLIPPAGGDDLQGVKKGILEVADSVAITKYDGSLKVQARHTKADYSQSIKLTTSLASSYVMDPHLHKEEAKEERAPSTKIHLISTKEDVGIDGLVEEVFASFLFKVKTGSVDRRREGQVGYWFSKFAKEQFVRFLERQTDPLLLAEMTRSVQAHEMLPSEAARRIIEQAVSKASVK